MFDNVDDSGVRFRVVVDLFLREVGVDKSGSLVMFVHRHHLFYNVLVVVGVSRTDCSEMLNSYVP